MFTGVPSCPREKLRKTKTVSQALPAVEVPSGTTPRSSAPAIVGSKSHCRACATVRILLVGSLPPVAAGAGKLVGVLVLNRVMAMTIAI